MKKRIIILSVFLLLTGCQNIHSNIEPVIQNTEVSTADSQGDNISDDELGQISYIINNLNLSNSNVNSLPFYIKLDKDSVGILKYINNADYKVTITIKGVTDSRVYKKIDVSPNSDKEIRFSTSSFVKENEASFYTIDIHCSEVNFNGILTIQSALKNN